MRLRKDFFGFFVTLSFAAIVYGLGYSWFVSVQARVAGNPDWRQVPAPVAKKIAAAGAVFGLCLAGLRLSGLLKVNAQDPEEEFAMPASWKGITLACGGLVQIKDMDSPKAVACTKGCLHSREELKAGFENDLGRLTAAIGTQTSRMRWRGRALAVVVVLSVLSQIRSTVFFGGTRPGDLGFLGLSLGYYHLLGRDWTGVELLIIGGCLFFGYVFLGGPLPKRPSR